MPIDYRFWRRRQLYKSHKCASLETMGCRARDAKDHQVPFYDSLVCLDLGLNPNLLDHWCPGDRGSISGQLIPKAQKRYLILHFQTPSIISYGSKLNGAIQGKEKHSLWYLCSSPWKGSLRVALDYGHRLDYIIRNTEENGTNTFSIWLPHPQKMLRR